MFGTDGRESKVVQKVLLADLKKHGPLKSKGFMKAGAHLSLLPAASNWQTVPLCRLIAIHFSVAYTPPMVKHQSNSFTPVKATCSCKYHFLSHPSSAIGYFFSTEGALLRTGVSIDPNKTKWSRQVRKLILDSDSEILDFWSFDEKKNGEIYMHTYAYSANSAFSENQRWLLST